MTQFKDGEIPGYFPLLVPDMVELMCSVQRLARRAVNTDCSACKVHVLASEAYLSVVFTARDKVHGVHFSSPF